jgi:hypothetical protein
MSFNIVRRILPVWQYIIKAHQLITNTKNFSLEMLAQLAGKTDVRNFELEDLRAITVDAAAVTGVKLAGGD